MKVSVRSMEDKEKIKVSRPAIQLNKVAGKRQDLQRCRKMWVGDVVVNEEAMKTAMKFMFDL